MSSFRGSLQDWRRYIDERTRAVREKQESPEASVGADTDETSVVDDRPVSEHVEAILAKQKAIQEEIGGMAHPAPPAKMEPIPDEEVPEPTILEAAAMFARLPRHIQMLVRPTQGEVAQNSYKNKFSETREELILRILDPQLSLEETARILNVCPTTVRRYTNRSLLKQERTPGNHRRFRLSDVLDFLEKYGDQVHD